MFTYLNKFRKARQSNWKYEIVITEFNKESLKGTSTTQRLKQSEKKRQS